MKTVRVDIRHIQQNIKFQIFCHRSKNYIFCKIEKEVNTTAELFSNIQTAQVNLLIPDKYLSYMMYHINSDPIEDLLPWSVKIPEEIHIHKEELEERSD